MDGLQIVSDLHLEQNKLWSPLPVEAKYLVILGDTCPIRDTTRWHYFLKVHSPLFNRIFLVNGNHEYHSNCRIPMVDLKRKQAKLVAKFPNVTVLNKTAIPLLDLGVTLLGVTLWSHVPEHAISEVKEHMTDYVAIRNSKKLTISDTNVFHASDLKWLKTEITARPEENLVILTHHAPLLQGTSDPKYEGLASTHGFASDLSYLFNRNVVLWAFGHTHWACNFRYQYSDVLSNPRGYRNEIKTFQPNLVWCI